jgi:hypothetical protein
MKDVFGFNKAINWDKLNDPKVLKELEKVLIKKPKKKKKDNSKKNDMFLNCRSCSTIITNDYRSKFDKRYCADCL